MGGGGRVLWPKLPPAPVKALRGEAGVPALSCVEAALWLEERWQSVTGAAGATTCAVDAAGKAVAIAFS